MRYFVLLALGLGFAWMSATADDPQVKIFKSTYRELGDLVKQQKGHVVLVDFWGEFCPPCKAEFPNVVTLHRKYESKGLRCISASVDDPEDEAAGGRAWAFLKQRKATFMNVWISDPPKVWQEKLKTLGPPCVYLFDSDGRLVNRWFGAEIDFDVINRRVGELLDAKE